MPPLALALAAMLAQAPASDGGVPESSPLAPGVPAPSVSSPLAAAASPGPTETPWWQRVSVNGFARVGVFYAFPLRTDQLVGSAGGFRLADLRLGAVFTPVDRFSVEVSVELAAPLGDDADPLTGRRVVELRDGIVGYRVADALEIRAGQMRPPFAAEMLLGDGELPFISRSVLAQGILPPEGYGPRTPLTPDRQLGVTLSSRRLGGAVGFTYAVGVFNGNGQNQLFNDNNSVEPVARVTVDVARLVTLGLNAAYNLRSDGPRPDRLATAELSYGADVTTSLIDGHLTGLAQVVGKSSTFSYAGLQPDTALGVVAQVKVSDIAGTGVESAARFAWFEPSVAQVQDQVIEVAAMVGWRPFRLPFRIFLQYTHRAEETQVAFPNDSVDVMLHAVW